MRQRGTCQRSKQLMMRASVACSGMVHGSATASCISLMIVARSGRLKRHACTPI